MKTEPKTGRKRIRRASHGKKTTPLGWQAWTEAMAEAERVRHLSV